MKNKPTSTACLDVKVEPAPSASTFRNMDASATALVEQIEALIKDYAPRPAAAPFAKPQHAAGGNGASLTRSETSVPACPEAAPHPSASTPRGANPPEDAAPAEPAAPAAPGDSRELPAELKTAKIMIVDDEEANVLAVKYHLKKAGYEKFISTSDSREAIDLIHAQQPDVLLLDIKMPYVSGLDILRFISMDKQLQHIPVIVLTAATDPATKKEALDLGANDFLTKPLDPNDLLPRVRNALVVKQHFDQVAKQAAKLEELVERRTVELYQSRQQLILSLGRAAEHRDDETGNHVIRVGCFAALIARELGWNDSQTDMIEQAAQLHDVGKIGIPDAILFKPGKLDPQEYQLIKSHCAIGVAILEPFSEKEFQVLRRHTRFGESILHVRNSPMLMMASRIAQTHHECWDGTGYPLGLAGEDIPIEGRITAVADVFDALSSRRPYKEPFPREKCFEILREQRGQKFDPHVLDAFFARSTEIVEVQLQLMDRNSGRS